MITFLTSSPTRDITPADPLPALYTENGFVERLRALWPERARCLMIAAFPGDHPRNDEMTWFYSQAVQNAGLEVECFDLWDDRRPHMGREELHSYHAVFLAGGHVFTELDWFESIHLRRLLEGYGGLVIGTSAGSMNCARLSYGWPEEPGETFIPEERLFRPGLGLAETVVLPHYQKVHDMVVDGKRLFEEVTYGHSRGRRFLAIPDGSYVLVRDGKETVYGQAWLITGGEISLYCREDEFRELK